MQIIIICIRGVYNLISINKIYLHTITEGFMPLQEMNIDQNLAQVAMPKILLEKLIAMGIIHGGECLSLNSIAKKVIWQALLNNSVNLEYK